MKRSVWVFIAVIFFALCLIIATPAWIVRDILVKQQPAMAVGNVTGRVWSGELDVVQYQGITLSGISWTLNPIGLFSGVPLAIAVTEPVNGAGDVGIGSEETLQLRKKRLSVLDSKHLQFCSSLQLKYLVFEHILKLLE